MTDMIGSFSGGISHLFPGRQSERIEDANPDFGSTRSGIELGHDPEWLKLQAPEVRAALIADKLYERYSPEFNTNGYVLARIAAGTIVEEYYASERHSGEPRPHSEETLVSFFGVGKDVIPALQEIAWLQYAFDAGATAADLEAWGVSRFTIIQLLWWKRREGETRLQQHVRAERNGWWQRYLGFAVRDAYRNLLKFSDNGTTPEWFAEKYRADLDEVIALDTFFSKDAQRLDTSSEQAWAEAFLAAGIRKIAPDGYGPFAHFLPASFNAGQLRKPLELIARYLESIGTKPADWADFDESFFGRKQDKAV